MKLEELRWLLTDREKSVYEDRNYGMLSHISINSDLLSKINEDIEMIPKISRTSDNVDIEFDQYRYQDEMYYKDELLAFIFASCCTEWNIVIGFSLDTLKKHFWLENEDIVYDPSLTIVTVKYLYYKNFTAFKVIKQEEIDNYLSENNNLQKFYENEISTGFSINFINNIRKVYNENLDKQLNFTEERIEKMKQDICRNNFIELRQFLTLQRLSFLNSSKIAIHPSINPHVLDSIEIAANKIYELMQKEYNKYYNYYGRTMGNCYGLSGMLNLYDESFKLIQGGIPYTSKLGNLIFEDFYYHSWLEKQDFVYDPAFRIITPKALYYQFVQKQDEYTTEETENILRRIGFNFSFFRAYFDDSLVLKDLDLRYGINAIDSKESIASGEKLIALIREIKSI